MKTRKATINRDTNETQISVTVNLDGTGQYEINTGVGFLDHMLELLSKHSLIDINLCAKGDLEKDDHHTIEDVGIALGQAISEALGDKRGIERYGFLMPMDETLAEVALDLGGRFYFVWDVDFTRENINDMPTEMFEHFFYSFADNLRANLHINLRYGKNDHHKAEAIFKSVGRSLRFALSQDPRNKELMPSTKGTI
ncbi:imidazoleglycerol-phosphate dehydratase HisB [Candidatus Saccharibacteria bacterium]|jgi:imidazoleglycerol-phosphate dehydratase|nr:imidazoleglycerol-phosphate dehydratase HisB [Candidatus Saccharibacteria bacterium]